MSRIFQALQQASAEAGHSHPDDVGVIPVLSELVTSGNIHSQVEEAERFRILPSPQSRLVSVFESESLAAEKLRVLAARMKYARQRRPFKKVLITSSVRGDGKSFLSANLAFTLALQGEKTLLIDGDLHQPTLARMLGVEHSEALGFGDWWQSGRPIGDFLLRHEEKPLWLLAGGGSPENSAAMLQSEETSSALEQLATNFSWIIIDSPPLLPMADSGVWVNLVDAVLLVARKELTPKKLLQKSLECIDKAKLFGTVMNDVNTTEERYYRDYYRARIAK